MTKLEMSAEIRAPPKKVWQVIMDPSYLPKLYPDVISVEVDPPGLQTVGQRAHLVGKAGKRKLEIFSETTELVSEKKITSRNRPGGLFKSFGSVILLEPRGDFTMVKTSFEYEISMGYIGKVFNIVLLERLVSDNLKAYTRNLKDLSELVSLQD